MKMRNQSILSAPPRQKQMAIMPIPNAANEELVLRNWSNVSVLKSPYLRRGETAVTQNFERQRIDDLQSLSVTTVRLSASHVTRMIRQFAKGLARGLGHAIVSYANASAKAHVLPFELIVSTAKHREDRD